jgi:cytochrome c553
MTRITREMRRHLFWILTLALLPAIAIVAQPPQQQNGGKDLSWAFPSTPDKDQPPPIEGPRHIPDSSKAYTQAQIDDLSNPPDWFPDQHPAAPAVVTHGNGDVLACGACHLMSGMGHAESSQLAGLPADYIAQQMADFKSGARKDPARMTAIGKAMSPEDAKAAADYFSALKPIPWNKVVEADTVPKTYLNGGRQRLPLPAGGTEPIGMRIIEVPQDPALATARDPRSGFTDYVPTGSIAKGQSLVTTGGGKTIPCGICHGTNLLGMGDVPRIAGLSPVYIARQLYRFQQGDRNGDAAELMKPTVAQLNDDDIIAVAAFLASKPPQ